MFSLVPLLQRKSRPRGFNILWRPHGPNLSRRPRRPMNNFRPWGLNISRRHRWPNLSCRPRGSNIAPVGRSGGTNRAGGHEVPLEAGRHDRPRFGSGMPGNVQRGRGERRKSDGHGRAEVDGRGARTDVRRGTGGSRREDEEKGGELTRRRGDEGATGDEATINERTSG